MDTYVCRKGKSGHLAKIKVLHPNAKHWCSFKTFGIYIKNQTTTTIPPPSINHPDAFWPFLEANCSLGARAGPGLQRSHPAGRLQPLSPSHQGSHRSNPAPTLRRNLLQHLLSRLFDLRAPSLSQTACHCRLQPESQPLSCNCLPSLAGRLLISCFPVAFQLVSSLLPQAFS